MKAMLYADWLNFRQSLRSMLLILVVFAFAAFAWSGPMFFIMIVVMLSIMLPATLCASDQAYGWDKLSLSLPILRREVVGSKYLIGLLANLALCALAAAMTVIYSAVDASVPLTENLLGLFCGEIISLLLMGLMLAITFKFGVEKSRYILIGVVWIPRSVPLFHSRGGDVCGGTAPAGSSSLAFPISRMMHQSVICPPVRSVRPQQPASI